VFESASRVRLAHALGIPLTREYQHAAGKYADAATLIAAHELGMQYTADTMTGAARYNKLAALQHLHAQSCSWAAEVCESIAARGELEMLRWVHEQGCFWDGEDILVKAAGSGNLELTAWVLQRPGVQATTWVIAKAAEHGHIAVCQFLRSEQCAWDDWACDSAVFGDRLDTLLWLRKNGAPFDLGLARESAGQGGSISVNIYLHKEGLLDSEALTGILNIAGSYNRIAAAQLLWRLGAAWPAELCWLQPWDGATLAWARAEGCASPIE
jgi:hypothetical protein